MSPNETRPTAAMTPDEEITPDGYVITPLTRKLEAKRAARDEAMRKALLIIYEDLAGLIDSNTPWSLSALGGGVSKEAAQWDCVTAAMDENARGGPELREEAAPYLDAIRALEAQIGGHMADTAPDWMRRLIDGEAGL